MKASTTPLAVQESAALPLAAIPLPSLSCSDYRSAALCPHTFLLPGAAQRQVRKFLTTICWVTGCLLALLSSAYAEVKVYEWGTNWTAEPRISTDLRKYDWHGDNDPFPNSVAFRGQIVSASTEAEEGRIRCRIVEDGYAPGSSDGQFSGTQPIEIEIRCAAGLAALLIDEKAHRDERPLESNFVFDRKSGKLVALYFGYAWKSNLTLRGQPDVLLQEVPEGLPTKSGWYKPTIHKGTYVRALPWDLQIVAFEFDAAAFNNLWLLQNPGGGRRTIPAADCYFTPSGPVIHLSKGYGNGADPPEVETKTASILSSEFFGTGSSAKSSGALTVLPEVQSVDFPSGFLVLDAPNGKVLKRVDGPTSANVRAYKEVKGQRFYISDWSYDRISGGKQPNYILSQ